MNVYAHTPHNLYHFQTPHTAVAGTRDLYGTFSLSLDFCLSRVRALFLALALSLSHSHSLSLFLARTRALSLGHYLGMFQYVGPGHHYFSR